MKFIQMKYNGKVYKSQKEIDSILKDLKFYWLIDSEFENAEVEIIKDTIIWHTGFYFSGNWEYGIFRGGKFYGNWKNGIWENGIYAGYPDFEKINGYKDVI